MEVHANKDSIFQFHHMMVELKYVIFVFHAGPRRGNGISGTWVENSGLHFTFYFSITTLQENNVYY